MTSLHQVASDTGKPASRRVPSLRSLYAAVKGEEDDHDTSAGQEGAMAAVFLPGNLQDEATCSVCLEYFKEPVSIECGHNFCRGCIAKSWKSLEGEFPCPQCREVFKEKSFRPNRQLANMAEIISQFILHGGKGLEDDGICEKHKEALKLYCKDDQMTICVVCDRSRDHRPHSVVPVEEAAQEYKEQIQNRLDFLKKERQELLEFKIQDDKKSQDLLKTVELERQKVLSEFEVLRQFLHELAHRTAEMKLRVVQAEERLEMEKKRSKQALEDAESLRLKEVGHMTYQLETSERAWQERIQRLEGVRIRLEEELSRVKATALIERSHIEEEVIKAKNQAKLEEQQRVEHLEGKLRLMMQARDEAQNCCLHQKQVVAEVHAKESQMSLQVEGLTRRVEELHQELSNKDQVKVAEVNKVRVELQEQVGHLEAERTAQEGMREKIAALERQLKVLCNNHREALLDKEGDICSLQEKLRVREAEISRMREEEAQRASFLHNAIMAYMQACPLGTLSPKK